MKWPSVLTGLLDKVENDPQILSLLGGPHLYHTPDRREYHVPMIGYTVINTRETEVYESFYIQWDVIAPPNKIMQLHDRLKHLVSADTPRKNITMTFQDAQIHEPPLDGVHRHSLDVLYEIARDRRY